LLYTLRNVRGLNKKIDIQKKEAKYHFLFLFTLFLSIYSLFLGLFYEKQGVYRRLNDIFNANLAV